jgi:hypothetical protein
MIPAFAAVFALMFTVAVPYVMAEGGDYSKWDSTTHHKKHMKIQIGELTGSKAVTRETAHDEMDNTIALSVATYNYPDTKKASLGIAVNDAGEKFLLGYKITTIEKSFDYSTDGKWSHHGMYDKFADMTPEEREAKFAQFKEMKQAFSSISFAQFKEMKQAFSSISEQDREIIKSHFKEMKAEYATLSDEQKDVKHAEFKSKMEEFSALTLDEKIAHLQDLANSLR